MRKFIVFSDGGREEIIPLSYREFMNLDLWHGGSDIAFNVWLYHNKLIDLADYTEEALAMANIEIENSLREYEFCLSEDDLWLDLTAALDTYNAAGFHLPRSKLANHHEES